MFGLMRNLLKEKEVGTESVNLADLHAGCTVGFGFMPQKNISGRRLPVTETNSYLFDGDSFIAYRLERENTDVNLIIADGENTAATYLAISRKIKERFFSPLFVSPLPEGWFALNEGDAIDVASRVLGAPQGWLALRYTVAVKTKGRILEGDFRLRNPEARESLARAFDYVLLVDEENTHALEAERYEDGTLNVYATVYRPATDIGEISQPPRKAIAEPVPVLPVAETILSNIRKEEETAPAPEEPVSESRQITVTTTELAPMHTKFGRIQPISASAPVKGDMLAFDTALAARIIDEAQRNKMPLSELVRKVIDLPARISEQVFVPFSLDNAEYAELARRYGLSASDRSGVRERILEELRQFAGLTKE